MNLILAIISLIIGAVVGGLTMIVLARMKTTALARISYFAMALASLCSAIFASPTDNLVLLGLALVFLSASILAGKIVAQAEGSMLPSNSKEKMRNDLPFIEFIFGAVIGVIPASFIFTNHILLSPQLLERLSESVAATTALIWPGLARDY